jgi:hypothetical protein
MHRGILHTTFTLDQIRYPPSRPEAGAIPQGFGTLFQPLHDALAIDGRELRRPAGTRCTLQGLASALVQLPRPAIHRLPMDSDAARDFGFGYAALEQPRRLQTPLL